MTIREYKPRGTTYESTYDYRGDMLGITISARPNRLAHQALGPRCASLLNGVCEQLTPLLGTPQTIVKEKRAARAEYRLSNPPALIDIVNEALRAPPYYPFTCVDVAYEHL